MKHILLVEDDMGIALNLKSFLAEEGFMVDVVNGQKEALEWLMDNTCDLALLDVCSYIKQNTDTSVIFLTASGDEYSVVSGLDMGADDYISKPFRPRELVSRIRSVLRRAGKVQSELTIGDIRIDTARALVTRKGEEIPLSALEYRLFLLLVNNQGILLTRERLLDEIWDAAGEFVNDNTLTVYIKRLREKIETDPSRPQIILTVRGMGYKVADA